MRLGIIGGGVVGKATARAFIEFCQIRVHDVLPERSTHDLDETLDSDIIMICLPTPQKDGLLECDLGYINSFFRQRYEEKRHSLNYVIRSTVPVGTTASLRKLYGMGNLIHSPEFLTARCSVVDAQTPSRNIIGGEECQCRILLGQLYRARFPGTPTYMMTSGESEFVKLMLNSFFALKVSFFNEANAFADRLGMDWGRVLQGLLSDGRIAQSHCNVPGPDGRYGYSGACLPKDIASFVSQMCDVGLEPTVCMASIQRNRKDRERKS